MANVTVTTGDVSTKTCNTSNLVYKYARPGRSSRCRRR